MSVDDPGVGGSDGRGITVSVRRGFNMHCKVPWWDGRVRLQIALLVKVADTEPIKPRNVQSKEGIHAEKKAEKT